MKNFKTILLDNLKIPIIKPSNVVAIIPVKAITRVFIIPIK